MIAVEDVHKHFKEVKAVDGVDLEICRGEYLALLGPNGAGKTTLVEMIEGIQKPDKGRITIVGKSWNGNEDALHRIIGLSLQETRFIDKLRVEETLRLFSTFYGLKRQRIEEVLDLVNLQEKRRAFVVNLSGGQRQRLALGIALINRPQILLLDEPTTGLDPTARREVWDILTKLKKQGTTMILTTHYMEEASYLCDRIVIMDQGKILAKGSLDELLSEHVSGEIIEFAVEGDLSQDQLPYGDGVLKMEYDVNTGRGEIVVKDLVAYLPELLSATSSHGARLIDLECRKMTLDDLFIAMTGRHLSE